jgi:DNA-binding transcriptional ArsR family regulator
MGDAIQLGITDRLQIGPASSAEIAADLDLPASTIRQELRKLNRAGIVERVGKTSRRGVSEFLYSADLSRGVLRHGDLADLPDHLHDAAHARFLRQMHGEAMEAIEAGTFYARDEFALIRFVIPLDDRGWAEACLLHDGLTDLIIESVEAAKIRIQDGGREGETLLASAAAMFFEASSPWPVPLVETGEDVASTRRAPKGRGLIDTMAALGDPLRLKIIDALSLGPRGVGELADGIGAPREKVRYELGSLREMGAVEVHSRRRRRGMEELVCVCQNRKLVMHTDDMSTCDPGTLDGFCRDTVADVFRGALAATKAGVFKDREDFTLNRIPGLIDREAFDEISAQIAMTLDRLFELRDRCMVRLGETEESPRPGISNLLLFERPLS